MPKRNQIERQKNRNNNNLTSKQVKSNIEFLSAILRNATPENLAVWRKKLPTFFKPIKTGLKKNLI